ncbi:hypothetical protein PILCRDRAFT_9131 [Piloderma croceum F 1598]|uniref:F-box domain-containing protein n=1 Tax=Piloderma croceum (strain F 1598) TaxID=765440 RepID=A0A0C3FPK2_PILCF|nr:hypothetical protein PILCRDRAFT_9131 [Piloderma croceum F 1598]
MDREFSLPRTYIDKLLYSLRTLPDLIPTPSQTFRRSPVEPADWVRFKYYACRIKVLGSTCRGGLYRATVHGDALRVLNDFRPGFSLLPSLRHLTLSRWNQEMAAHIEPYLSRSIITFEICNRNPPVNPNFNEVYDDLLSSLAILCPFIVDLRIPHGTNSAMTSHYPGASLECAREWNHLQTIFVSSEISLDAFRFIAPLPNLKDLSCFIHPNFKAEDLRDASQGPFFRSLEILDVQTYDIAPCRTLMELMVESPLVSVIVAPNRSLLLSDVGSFISAVCRPPAHRFINDFRLMDCEYMAEVDHYVGTTAFEPLFMLKELRTLSISFPSTCRFDDQWLARAANTWPNLEHFSVLGAKDGVPQITFQGMTALLDSSPGLCFIELDIDERSADFTSKHQVTYPNIRTLSLGRSFIDAPLKILEHISNVFPDLNALTAWTDGEDMDHPQCMLWKIVLKLWHRKLTDGHNPWYTLFGIGCDQVLMSIYSQKLDHLRTALLRSLQRLSS